MAAMNLFADLSANAYPGRGILLGKSDCGKYAVCGYFIMGRSVNSRNRVFVMEGEEMRTKAYDPAKLSDPSLIIYYPVRVLGKDTIVTNGDQTDTIRDFMAEGKTFEDALRTRTFEPDSPNFTPRISGLCHVEDGALSYRLSILKTEGGVESRPLRFFYEYSGTPAGEGHLIHTYQGDGNPLPSFTGEPKNVTISGGIDEFTANLWNALDSENKVSLFVRYIDLATGETQTRIVNGAEQ